MHFLLFYSRVSAVVIFKLCNLSLQHYAYVFIFKQKLRFLKIMIKANDFNNVINRVYTYSHLSVC